MPNNKILFHKMRIVCQINSINKQNAATAKLTKQNRNSHWNMVFIIVAILCSIHDLFLFRLLWFFFFFARWWEGVIEKYTKLHARTNYYCRKKNHFSSGNTMEICGIFLICKFSFGLVIWSGISHFQFLMDKH